MDKHGVRINIEYRSTCGMDQPGVWINMECTSVWSMDQHVFISQSLC